MNEISYQIFDKHSKLPIMTLSDSNIRTIAASKNQTLSETFLALKKEVEEVGVKYSISMGENKILALPKNAFFQNKNIAFFDSYEETLKILKDMENQ